jgi:nucleotidyltransferase/DNA polymerase involved in DNA repair
VTERRILHVDMDAFYASVEQRDHPALRGKPVIVGADPRGGRGRGVVSACSYEARKFGVRSALPISQAYRLCPHGVYLPTRLERYAEVSARIHAIFHRVTDLVEAISIDEAFLDVTASQRLLGPAEQIARRLKAHIRAEEGLVASIGVATNKFVAKVASDLGKPDGFVVVPPGEEPAFLAPLPIGRLWGVGRKTEARLRDLGIARIGDLARFERRELEAIFGKNGGGLWELARGLDDRPVVPESDPKSIGAETTFGQDTDDPEVLRRTVLKLADRVARRLRDEGFRGGTVTLKFRYEDFTTLTRAQTLEAPTDVATTIYRTALQLLEQIPRAGRKVRLLGVSASKLAGARDHPAEQLGLFSKRDERRRNVERIVDQIRAKFGARAITLGSLVSRPAAKGRPRGGQDAEE